MLPPLTLYPPLPRSAKCSQPEWPALADNIPQLTFIFSIARLPKGHPKHPGSM